MEIVRDFILGGSKITVNGDCCHEIKRHLLLGSKAMTNLDSKLNSRDKGPSGQSYGFSSSHIWMWELDSKESWSLKNWCFWAVVLKTLDSPLDCKEIKSVNPKGYQFCIFIGSADTDAEAPIIWPPDAKKWLIWKDRDAGKGWKQEEETTEDGMVGWHHWLSGHEFEQALEVGNGLGSLGSCNPWGRKELDTTEQLNWTETWFGWWFSC